ncbi:MAG: hypothetical protein JXR94_13705 [Candidatus Hydrogenedentes bacterium]|nr:hypothetical protein [Candidatus Hydrogenedentota bacterium]
MNAWTRDRPPAGGPGRWNTKARRALNALLRAIGYTAALALCCAASMSLSYFAVRHLTARESPAQTGDLAAIQQGEQLRAFSNELIRLTSEYLRRRPADNAPVSDSFTDWLGRDFMPRLNDLRRRMQAADTAAPPHNALVRASDQVAAMASHPERAHLQRIATEGVLKARADTEAYLRSLDVSRYLSQPPAAPGFGPSR